MENHFFLLKVFLVANCFAFAQTSGAQDVVHDVDGLSSIASAHSSCPCLTFALSNKTISTMEPVNLDYTMNLAGMEGRVERFIYISLEHSSPSKTPSPPSRTLRATIPYAPSQKNTLRLLLSPASLESARCGTGVSPVSPQPLPTPQSSDTHNVLECGTLVPLCYRDFSPVSVQAFTPPPPPALENVATLFANHTPSAFSHDPERETKVFAQSGTEVPHSKTRSNSASVSHFKTSLIKLESKTEETKQHSEISDTLTTLHIPPDTRNIILTVIGEAKPSAYLTPIGVNYGSIPQSKINSTPRIVSLRGANKNATLTAAVAAPPFILTLAPDKKSLSVSLQPAAAPGLHIQTAEITTTDPDVPQMPIYLYAHILGDLEILPNAIEVSADSPRAAAMLLIRTTQPSKTPFHILSAVTVPELGNVRLRSLPDGSWRVHLSEIPTAEILPRSFLLLKTNSPTSPEIKIPIRIAN